jgi:hypothetical protein
MSAILYVSINRGRLRVERRSLQGVQLRDRHFPRLDEPVPYGFVAGVAGSDLDVVAIAHDVDAACRNERFVSHTFDIRSHTLEIILQALVDRSRRDASRRHECILGQHNLQELRGFGIDRIVQAEFLADYLIVGFFSRLDGLAEHGFRILCCDEIAGFDNFRCLLLNRFVFAAGFRLLRRVAAASGEQQKCAEREYADDMYWSHDLKGLLVAFFFGNTTFIK